LNDGLFQRLGSLLASRDDQGALAAYIRYLNERSGTYMLLESTREYNTAADAHREEDPFRTANGYHRIALAVMNALCGVEDQRLIVNVRNQAQSMVSTQTMWSKCRARSAPTPSCPSTAAHYRLLFADWYWR
jgi:6-phospho-beta-glucosidase